MNIKFRKCLTCGKKIRITSKNKNSRFCSKKCIGKNELIKNKIVNNQRKTFIEKYGGYPSQNENIKLKIKNSIISKYGIYPYSKSEDFKKKTSGSGCSVNKRKDLIKKMRETCLEKYGNIFFKKTKTYKSQIREKIIKDFTVDKNFNIKAIQAVCEKRKRKIINEIISYLKEQIFEHRNIHILENPNINGITVDILLPDKKIAFDIVSLFFNSKKSGLKNKVYLKNKRSFLLTKGIFCIFISELDWIQKNEIVKSFLKNLFCKTENKIHARLCKIIELNSKTCNAFLRENCIFGSGKSSIRYGLVYNDKLVCVMTFIKSRYDKNIEYELNRFCSSKNTIVRGGFSKLFNFFILKHSPKTIVAYNSLNYFEGKIFSKNNFYLIKTTPPNCFFIDKTYNKIYSKMNFYCKIKKLNNIIKNTRKKTYYDIMWNCGYSKWIWNCSNQNKPGNYKKIKFLPEIYNI